MTYAKRNHRQRGVYGTLPLDQSGSVNTAALTPAPVDNRPHILRARPVHRATTEAMTIEAQVCRGSLTSTYTLVGRDAGPATITRNAWCPITPDEMARICDLHVDLADFHDGQSRIRRRIRKLSFRHRETGEPIHLPEIADEVIADAI